ncbi:MAG: ATP-dependent DNA helicase RecG [Candidatus Cloacimonadia bacterium]
MAFGLNDAIQYVPGVGPKRAHLFKKLGITTVQDLLFHFPRDYINKATDKSISELKISESASIRAKIVEVKKTPGKHGKSHLEIILYDGSGYLTCIWFSTTRWLENQFRVGTEVIVMGSIKYYFNRLCMIHPDFELVAESGKGSFWAERNLLPVYPLTEKLSNKLIRNIVYTIFTKGFQIRETLPPYIREDQGLLDLYNALRKIHIPDSDADIKMARGRFIFEEFFYLQLMLARKKVYWHKRNGYALKIRRLVTSQLKQKLPFEFTNAQKHVLNEIVKDMSSPIQMNRLLQGDVGSGKTIVSLFAMLLAVENGFQAALMAPTEVLATQHLIALRDFLQGIDVKIGLLLGGSYPEKAEIKQLISNGKLDIVVGTHSLIQSDVEFRKLGLVVIDEQHRFGVLQRQSLSQKGQAPDRLFMSATPIPRSLALTIYGDLDISIIDELPPQRKEIYTNWVSSEKKPQIYDFMKRQIFRGRQAYVVCPLVEDTGKSDLHDATSTYEELRTGPFKVFSLGLLHGKMSSQEKDTIMHQFKRGEIDVLVCTTVIEVGIDVPNATIMVIEHAEHFGLSQLHQLRGRVGRGVHKSYCALIAYEPLSEEALIRLNTMKATNDGFKIAEIDLELRGPGEFFGTEQSGFPRFKIANIVRDRDILESARELALSVIQEDYNLRLEKNRELKDQYKKDYLQREKLFSY